MAKEITTNNLTSSTIYLFREECSNMATPINKVTTKYIFSCVMALPTKDIFSFN